MVWLPKDERKILAACYRTIGKVGTMVQIDARRTRSVLKTRWWKSSKLVHAGDLSNDDVSPPKNTEKFVADAFGGLERVEVAVHHLDARGLICLQPINKSGRSLYNIGLTVEGYDLGRKYANWCTSTGLWFQEYQTHWMWLVVATLGGSLGGALINHWMAQILGDGP